MRRRLKPCKGPHTLRERSSIGPERLTTDQKVGDSTSSVRTIFIRSDETQQESRFHRAAQPFL